MSFTAFYFFATGKHISISSDALHAYTERRDEVVTRDFPQSIGMVIPSRIDRFFLSWNPLNRRLRESHVDVLWGGRLE